MCWIGQVGGRGVGGGGRETDREAGRQAGRQTDQRQRQRVCNVDVLDRPVPSPAWIKLLNNSVTAADLILVSGSPLFALMNDNEVGGGARGTGGGGGGGGAGAMRGRLVTQADFCPTGWTHGHCYLSPVAVTPE